MKNYITGAISGDIIGSTYEFNPVKSKDFPLFPKGSKPTDDSVLTLALAAALTQSNAHIDIEWFKEIYIQLMHTFCVKYPRSGYGGRFLKWLFLKSREPYNSFGNGSAMRVSPVAWYATTLEEAEKLAKASAEVTHNHPEGIKGAQVVAGAIFLARKGSTMAEIKTYCNKYYNLNFTLDEIRPTYQFDETCQGSVPQAIVSFLESTSFEDAIRNAISLGGDSDTLAAITGSIAEAYYGVDKTIYNQTLAYLDKFQLSVLEAFSRIITD